ncbi:bifunctional diguanylate cyclase/phosphodiesterase [Thalassotalea castellviae]|uniref:EAL domain-containing protein n=1 Tax=Thalassotalea castellviae TaxID=3075612 RepID=A0ABU3A1B5_9GAMM|nr:EAL domain-containing protein [Thalassotalea sp. W431]MDT0603967.1 EAL domain-containing protein [Thalassotalea sp. W431]
MLTRLSIRSQVAWLSALLIVITAITLTTSYAFRTAQLTEKQIERQMRYAQNVLTEYLSSQEQLLVTATRVLTADFGFKQAIATRDKNTIESVLLNHGERINADLMVMVDLQGELISISAKQKVTNAQVTEKVKKLISSSNLTQFLVLNNRIYQLIILPVKAPREIGYAIVGFQLSKASLVNLKNLTSLDITLVVREQNIVSSISDLENDNNDLSIAPITTLDLLISKTNYFNKKVPFDENAGISALLSTSLKEVHEEFNQLISSILFIALLIILISMFLSRLLSKGISTPLNYLMKLTARISRGELKIEKNEHRLPTEFNELYYAFSTMGEAISHREKEIKFQAEHDHLTGLYNRQMLLNIIDKCISANANLLLASINIKGFNQINDTIGPENGDVILKELAKRLQDSINAHHENINLGAAGRIDSDEFILVLAIADLKEIEPELLSLHDRLTQAYWVDDIKMNLELHIGSVNSIMHGKTPELLMRRVIMAMRSATKEQKAIRQYEDGEDEAYLEKIQMIEELRMAIHSENSPLFLNYQPKLNLSNNKIEKAEALIRWINKAGNFVNPEHFVSLAEKSGLIVSLTHWVIKNVAMQMEKWNEIGLSIRVSVNLSAQDIQHPEFVDYLLSTIEKYNVSPNQLTLELTERDLAENEEIVIERLSHLQTLGFQISVDDYGIGQSSLSKLKTLPVDELKIDKCFILSLEACPKDQDIVSSTISLGHKLNMQVVAEGVENKESLALLASYGCEYAQGYYISRPIDADTFVEWYKNYVPNY